VNSSPNSKTSAQHECADRKTQSARILRVLVDARGTWAPLPEIMACAAQYNARLHSLRRLGFHIENRTERDVAGAVHSWYRLVNSPASQTAKSEDLKSAVDYADWHVQQSGKPRPSVDRESLFLWERQ
jgi:hypothetical protein